MLISNNGVVWNRGQILRAYSLYKSLRQTKYTARLKSFYKDFEKDYILELESNPNFLLESTMIASELTSLTRPLIVEQYKQLLNHPWVKEDVLNQRIAGRLIENEVERTVGLELEAIKNNINFIREQIRNAEINLERFHELEKEPLITTRERLELASTNGLNIPTQGFGSDTYYNIDKLFDSYAHKADNISDYDSAKALNDIADEKGEDRPYTHKRWVWACRGEGETTRHSGMDGVVVEFDELFNVVNDITGEEEELLYPTDPSGSPQATYNCYCCAEYFKE